MRSLNRVQVIGDSLLVIPTPAPRGRLCVVADGADAVAHDIPQNSDTCRRSPGRRAALRGLFMRRRTRAHPPRTAPSCATWCCQRSAR
jgi:hypothetical protein